MTLLEEELLPFRRFEKDMLTRSFFRTLLLDKNKGIAKAHLASLSLDSLNSQ